MAEPERLQKVMAAAGIASRRASEELITAGRVRVDGVVVRELGTRVDPDTAQIEVDGKPVGRQRKRYLMLNKPSGYITTLADERARRTVADLIDVPERVVPVGRLDRPTQGLLLLTNDGGLAHCVMHPRYRLDKEYQVLCDGFPPSQVIQHLREGVLIDGRRTVPEEVIPLRETPDGLMLKVVIQEGRNRIVRRMFESVNYPVLRLIRTRVGPLQLGNLPRGAWRDLSDSEVAQLRDAVGTSEQDEPRSNTGRQPRRGRSRR